MTRHNHKARGIIGILAIIVTLVWNTAPGAEVIVQVDPGKITGRSAFQIGISHVTKAIHPKWGGDPAAIGRAMTHHELAMINLQNIHIMGWGVGNPNPAPDIYSWDSLDDRIARVMEMKDAQPVITFCTAPGWMKVSGEDWNMNDRVADEHFADFAELCAKIASRYPAAKYFQVWNEFKGFWNREKGAWDAVKYTEMYNAVYRAVRVARSDAKIGGLYKGFPEDMAAGGTLSQKNQMLLDTWLDNMAGADFICFDGWLQGWPNQTLPQEKLMELTPCFGRVAQQISMRTKLPVWVSEYYAAQKGTGNEQFLAANHASAYYHSLINGTAVALHWDPFDFVPLFSDPRTADGGRPTAHYAVVKAFNTHFGPGARLVEATSSSSDVEVLATAKKTLLINKRNTEITIFLNSQRKELNAYEVRLVESPRDP